MRKYLKIYYIIGFCVVGIIITIFTFCLVLYLLIITDKSDNPFPNNPSEIFGDSYSHNPNYVYVDDINSFYYLGKEYSFTKKEIVYTDDEETIYNDITSKIFYISDDIIIYRKSFYEYIDANNGYKYIYKYFLKNNILDSLLNIPSEYYLDNIKMFDDYFVFENRITKYYYYYDLLLDEYSEITKEEYEIYLNCEYSVTVGENLIRIHNNKISSEKLLFCSDIYKSTIVEAFLYDYLNYDGKDKDFINTVFTDLKIEIVENNIIINLMVYDKNNLLLLYDYDSGKIEFLDWFSHEKYVKNISIFYINMPNDNTVFINYINSNN